MRTPPQPTLFEDPQLARCREGKHAPLVAGMPYAAGAFTVNRDRTCPACGRLIEIESTRQDVRESPRARTLNG